MGDAWHLTVMSSASRNKRHIKPLARCQRDYSAPQFCGPEILDLSGRQHGAWDDVPAVQILIQLVNCANFIPDPHKTAYAAVEASGRFVSATANRTSLCGIGFVLSLSAAADTLELIVQILLELAQRVVAVLLVRAPRHFAAFTATDLSDVAHHERADLALLAIPDNGIGGMVKQVSLYVVPVTPGFVLRSFELAPAPTTSFATTEEARERRFLFALPLHDGAQSTTDNPYALLPVGDHRQVDEAQISSGNARQPVGLCDFTAKRDTQFSKAQLNLSDTPLRGRRKTVFDRITSPAHRQNNSTLPFANGLSLPDDRNKALELVRIASIAISVFPVRVGSFDIGKEALDQRLNRLAVEMETAFEMLLKLGGRRPRAMTAAKPPMQLDQAIPQACRFEPGFGVFVPQPGQRYLEDIACFHDRYCTTILSMKQDYRYDTTTVHLINYHFVWIPRRRRPVLTGDVAKRLRGLVGEKARQLDCRILVMEIMPDHVHLFLNAHPRIAPYQLMHEIKGYTARVLRAEFPHVLSRLPSMWTRSYFVSTAGNLNVSSETIQRYIEEQRHV